MTFVVSSVYFKTGSFYATAMVHNQTSKPRAVSDSNYSGSKKSFTAHKEAHAMSITFQHPKEVTNPNYGLYYSHYGTSRYAIIPIPEDGGPKLFHWHFHNGFECDSGDIHPLDHGLCDTFEDAQKQVEAFEILWNRGCVRA
jgi:hypothetical protein